MFHSAQFDLFLKKYRNMSDLKTKPTEESVIAFLTSVENETRRKDAFRIHELMTSITGERATMWGSSIVGYGQYHYIYKTGREGDWLLTGFSPRKQNLSLYILVFRVTMIC